MCEPTKPNDNNSVRLEVSVGLSEDRVEKEQQVFPRPLDVTRASDTEFSDCSQLSVLSDVPVAKKRRRPSPRTGQIKKQARDEGDNLDPSTSLSKAKKDLPRVEELQTEMKTQTTVDITTKIFECMSTVEKVADSSKNLKGAFVHSLRMMSRTVKAAAVELIERCSAPDITRLEKENGELKSQLTAMETKLAALTEEVVSLRQRDFGPVKRTTEPSRSHYTMGGDQLMEKISTLMDRKLSAFRAEIFPDPIRPPLGKKQIDVCGEPNINQIQRSEDKSALPVQVVKKGGKKASRPQELVKPVVPSGPPREWKLTQPSPSVWATVVGSKPQKMKSLAINEHPSTVSPVVSQRQAEKKAKPQRNPKSAAVTVTIEENTPTGYAAVLTAARQRVTLADCGIEDVRPKRAVTGGLVLEITGPDSSQKADVLTTRLREALTDMGAKIARPVKMGEIRVMDLGDSITQQDLLAALADAGECGRDEIKVGEICRDASRLGTAWIRCPLAAVHKLATLKYLRVGWIRARIQILAARKLQCYRCFEMGHVRQQCQNTVDRSSCCYNCGEQGHKARECTAPTRKCPVCSDYGLPSDHRVGGENCKPPKKKRTQRTANPKSNTASVGTGRQMSQQEQVPMETQNSQVFGFSKAT